MKTKSMEWPEALPGLEQSAWQPYRLECTLHGTTMPLKRCLQSVLRQVVSHVDAWPFQQAVSISVAPDYYDVIKDPIDLSIFNRRLADDAPPYYATVEMFLADVCRMCDNCRLYNGENNDYWDCAVRLEGFARSRCAEIKCIRQPIVAARADKGNGVASAAGDSVIDGEGAAEGSGEVKCEGGSHGITPDGS